MRDLTARTTARVSADPDGSSAANGIIRAVCLSPDGSAVAWTTDADYLGPNDTNGDNDVYLAIPPAAPGD